MPVSGLPPTAALLTPPQGSSGPDTKPFQNGRNTAGAAGGSKMATCDRLSHFTTIAETAAANKIDNASMLADQLSNTCWVRWRFCFSALALSLSSCALGVICRIWKERV